MACGKRGLPALHELALMLGQLLLLHTPPLYSNVGNKEFLTGLAIGHNARCASLLASFGDSMPTISKLDAAMHQLNLAITLFLGGDYLASLTLAGAAEDILGGLCKAAGKPSAAEFIANYHEKDVDPAVPAGKRLGVVFTVMNRARNAAKHADRPDENTVDVDQMHPLQMLMRAIPMCVALGVKPSDKIKRMVRWVKEHPEAQQ